MEAYFGVGGEAQHCCIKQGEEVIVRLACSTGCLGIFDRDTFIAQLGNYAAKEGCRILQTTQYVDEAPIIESKSREVFNLVDVGHLLDDFVIACAE